MATGLTDDDATYLPLLVLNGDEGEGPSMQNVGGE